MNRRGELLNVVTSSFVALVLTMPGLGQESRATLIGTITDSTGAAVAGATLRLRNTETGVESNAEASQVGQYHFLYVNPGSYRLTVEMQGFRTLVREGIAL